MDLLTEIDKVILSKEKDIRNYIGASSIGDECSLKIWKRFKGQKETYDALSLRRFEDGHSVEARIISWLRDIPDIELWDVDSNGEQFGFSALDGKYQGHYDGIIRIDGVTYVLEIKASKKFSTLVNLKEKHSEENVLRAWNEDYYAQGMTYCKFAGVDHHLLICSDAGGRELTLVRTPANHEFADALLLKAERIANSKEPPNKSGGKNYWKCKMCPFYVECWGQ
jgi:hypothetical protein